METLQKINSESEKISMEGGNYLIGGGKEAEKPKKDRRSYFQQRYIEKKEKWRERYQKIKLETIKETAESEKKYSDASAYRVLMSLKEYTELNAEKRETWLNFVWNLKAMTEGGELHFNDIIQVMKIRETAENLINDYWETAKNEERRGKRWNSLDQEKKDRLIQFFGRKKARWEETLEARLADEEEKGQKWEKEVSRMIEISKYHEERGKVKCKCWSCEWLKGEKELKKMEWEEKQKEKKAEMVRGECWRCSENKKVDSDSGLCKKCDQDQEAEMEI